MALADGSGISSFVVEGVTARGGCNGPWYGNVGDCKRSAGPQEENCRRQDPFLEIG